MNGENKDWFSQFGYFNHNEQEIKDTLQKIHNEIVPHPDNNDNNDTENIKLGEYLKSLWDYDKCGQFSIIFRKYKYKFAILESLRLGKWIKDFDQKPTNDTLFT